MLAFVLTAFFLYGMAAGRIFGGWLGLSRPLRIALFLPAILPALAVYPLNPELLWGGVIPKGMGFAIGLSGCLITIGLLALHIADGHRYDRPWKILLRYGWAPLILTAMTGTYAIALTGPVIALAAAICRICDFSAVLLPWDRVEIKDSSGQIVQQPSQMLDGWAAYWEMIKGGATMLAWAAPPLLWIFS